MIEKNEQQANLSKAEYRQLRDKAYSTLSDLITPDGLYASAANGWKGPYHSWFGRDTAITTEFICAASRYGGENDLAIRAIKSLKALSRWQGKKNDPETGEEIGKFPHEIRNTFDAVDNVQHAASTNMKRWYIDPRDNILKNWDSTDSTPLWVIAISRAAKLFPDVIDKSTENNLRRALEWMLNNLERHDGLMGFTGAALQHGRVYSGLHNQGWKDSYEVYQYQNGALASHPIKDVLANAETWSALDGAVEIFSHDTGFASLLRRSADTLKERFNDKFLLSDKTYFAQAIDGHDRQLRQHCADVAMCLWAENNQTCVIDQSHINSVVDTIMSPRMFNPYAGVRNYSLGTQFRKGTRYHGSAHTYWPFVSMQIARGLYAFNYRDESIKVMRAMLLAVHQLDSNIEMFVEKRDGTLSAWHHPIVDQVSSIEQAWTAGAVYFGTSFLLSASSKNDLLTRYPEEARIV